MKHVTDFHKTVEASVDLCLILVPVMLQSISKCAQRVGHTKSPWWGLKNNLLASCPRG